jgi:hypothetical protein
MTDRELLEKAAKAAGKRANEWVSPGKIDAAGGFIQFIGLGRIAVWNPLADDGDALRLANRLRINIERMKTLAGADFGINCWPSGRGDCGVTEEDDLSDHDNATRRAIVRAAAALGDSGEG